MSFMRYMYSLVVVVYILAHIGYLEATAGMRITVAETTLKMVNEAEINELQRDLNGKRFDGLRDSEGSWRLSNIHVQYLGTMTSGINLLSNGQIRWTCDISSITVEADWWGRLSGLLSFISAGGSLEAKARRTSLSISLTLTENSGGLGISLSICSASVGSFNLNFSDNLFSWLFNIISSVFQHDIKRTLEDSICDFVRKGMNNITADMRNINTSFPIEIIGIPLTLNNSFTQVTVNSNTISTYHKVVQKGLDEFRLTCKEGPPGICFGSIIRQVAEEYPDRVLGMQWKVHSANLNIQNGQIKAELTGRVNCSADSANESLPLFSAQVELVVAYELKFSAGELSARSVAWGGHANIDRSNIGKILIPSVQAATNVFILPALQKDILDMINECNSSYKFELPKNVFIKESGLSLYEGVVRVEADLCYKTTSCRSAPNNEWVGNKDIPKFTVDDIIPTHNDDDNNNNDTAIINNSIFV
ncbi:lipopolysaccharide-binding protein-like isoform X2 [Mercenaria mercenaria]|uniref:lipopolysaccharide-binding protein-like isoform X2 n=1 Tax=Mercenaria mercenaria TaxID=6596 RepID=UPI00234F3659|nr:lipopolysaccharide-binding protein-like isoform X2 [Mercenaria mercenaria]